MFLNREENLDKPGNPNVLLWPTQNHPLKASFQEQILWTLWNPNCTHLTTDRTFSYCFTEIHKWLVSLLASHWSLDDLGRKGEHKHICEQYND